MRKQFLFVIVFPLSLQIFDHLLRQEPLRDQLLRQLLGRWLLWHRRHQLFERLSCYVGLLRRRGAAGVAAAAAAVLPTLEFRLKIRKNYHFRTHQ